MSRRIASGSSAVNESHRSTIRHRSGAFDPDSTPRRVQRPRRHVSSSEHSNHSERTARTLVTADEYTDEAGFATAGVRLVRRAGEPTSTRSHFKPLPDLPFKHDPSGRFEDLRDGVPHLSRGHDSPCESRPYHAGPPLARPSHTERRDSDLSTHTSHSATSSRLPTPNYPPTGAQPVRRQLSSYFSRLPSFRARPPRPPRIESEVSTYTSRSDGSTAYSHPHPSSSRGCGLARVPTAIKDKRPLLASTFSTSDKFTQKFPRPRGVKGLNFSAAPSASFLEQGEGLGIERVERWTPHKWWLLLSVCTVLVYGAAGLVCALFTWFRAWEFADVMYVADFDLLVLLTLSSSILLLTALVGLSGVLLNSRPLLAVYALLLWPALFSMLAIGYPAYKRYAFALDRKLSRAWSEWYTPLGRRVVQDALGCCGFANVLHEAAPSAVCYPRSALPGCKTALWRVERDTLATVWGAVFALVPMHLVNIVVALVCANHVTRTFGKGITPKRYRLTVEDVRADAGTLVQALEAAGGGFRDVRAVVRPGSARGSSGRALREDRAVRDRTGYDALHY